jgi:hypothetical protein
MVSLLDMVLARIQKLSVGLLTGGYSCITSAGL